MNLELDEAKVDLSIIIVSYNVRDYLLSCLTSIHQHSEDFNFEVILVDNVSVDGTVEAVREFFPQVQIIVNTENVGFARANNQGLRACRGRYVLFLNPDTELCAGAVAGLIHAADSRPDAAAFACRMLNSDGTLQYSCFRFPNLMMATFGLFPIVSNDSVLKGRYAAHYFDRTFEPEHVLGACFMVRRQILEELGGMDENFYMYFEETDLCYRLKLSGHKIVYTPEFSVIHHGQQSTSAVKQKMSIQFYRSQAYFYRKHYGPFEQMALKAVVVLGMLCRIVKDCTSFLGGCTSWQVLQTQLGSYTRILLT
ncbi:MAG: glycosyltransferase family 2 protein [Chloroflexi bacterium]|nr:glycosyltransferase family 2 protein [Chloroflexota bacterium]